MRIWGFEIGKPPLIWLAASVLLMVLDQAIKWFVVLRQPEMSFGPVEFSLFLNKGMAFSLPVPQYIYLPIAVTVLAVFARFLTVAVRRNLATASGLALVVFGAFSNIIDRFAHGATVDYLIFFNLSAVNLADGMILLGVIFFVRNQRNHA